MTDDDLDELQLEADQFQIRGTSIVVAWIEDGFTRRRVTCKVHSEWFIKEFLTGERARRRFGVIENE